MKPWHCEVCSKVSVNSLFCECGSILPASTAFFMQELGLNDEWEIDKNQLELKYLEFISALHPDRYINKSSKEREIALFNSGILNNVYHASQNDLKRLELYLKEQGVNIESISINSDFEFLSWVMEASGQLENTNSDSERQELLSDIQSYIEQLLQELSLEFSKKNVKMVEILYAKLNTLNKLL